MAEPIEIPPPKPNPREELYHKLEKAPQEHAEALLDAYAILQLLRDKGLLEIAKGALGSGEKLLWVLTQTLDSDEAITAFRNLVVLTKILGGLNPEVLEDLEHTLLVSVNEAKSQKPPGLFKIFSRFRNKESRRALNTIAAVMESFGKKLSVADNMGRKRKKTTRHGFEA